MKRDWGLAALACLMWYCTAFALFGGVVCCVETVLQGDWPWLFLLVPLFALLVAESGWFGWLLWRTV